MLGIVFKIHEPSSAKVLIKKHIILFLKVIIIFHCKYTHWCIVTMAQSFVAVQHQEEKGRAEGIKSPLDAFNLVEEGKGTKC